MTRAEKCEAILDNVRAVAVSGKTVSFTEDWSPYSMTVAVVGAHSHVGLWDEPEPGTPEAEKAWSHLVDQLHAQLIEHRGLSWAKS
jgi:hypothetical protein